MAITSLKFFAFLAVIYLLYCLVPRQKRWLVLLGASLFFYVVCGSLRLFVVTLLQILVAYGAAIWTDKQQREGVSTKINTAEILTCLAVLFQIGALLYYKEMNFFVTNGNILLHLLGKESTLSLWQIVAPLGISYYTLSYIAYILDVYWGVVSPQRNFLKSYSLAFTFHGDHLWSDHMVSGDRTGFVCGKQSRLSGLLFWIAAHSVGTFQETGDRGSYGADRTGDLAEILYDTVC